MAKTNSMKKIFHFNLVVVLTLLIVCCGENKNSTLKNDTDIHSTTSVENVATENKSQEKLVQITSSKNDPPKYANKAAFMEHLISRCNNTEAPLTQEQIDQINALADDIKITVFNDHYTYNKFRKTIKQRIKSEVLTPEQIRLYPRKPKTKN
jgi:hypothetical protein